MKLFALVIEGGLHVLKELRVSQPFPGQQFAELRNGGLLLINFLLQGLAFIEDPLVFALADPAPLRGKLVKSRLKITDCFPPVAQGLLGVVTRGRQAVALSEQFAEAAGTSKTLMHPVGDVLKLLLALGQAFENIAPELVELVAHRPEHPRGTVRVLTLSESVSD